MSETPQTTALVLDARQYGLEPTRAEQIEKVFKPMHAVFHELDAEYKEIISIKEITTDVCERASDLRKRYVKVRTSAESAHKEAKANILIEGRAIDGLKNIIAYATTQNEDRLREIEEHFERIERERLAKLVQERSEALSKVGVDPSIYKLEEMADDVYENLLEISTKAFEERREREAKEEADRIAKAKAEQEENERIRKENEKLKKEAEEVEKKIAKERAIAEAKILEERKALEEKAKKEKEVLEAKLKAEQEAREKEQAEYQAKIDKEAKEEAARLKAEAKAKRAPDKKKLEDFAGTLIQLKMPEVVSVEANEVLLRAQELLKKTSEYILSQVDKF